MKPIEWIVAGVLIIAGIICLSMAPAAMMGNPMGAFFHTMITVCFWIVIPLLIIGSVYFFIIRKRK